MIKRPNSFRTARLSVSLAGEEHQVEVTVTDVVEDAFTMNPKGSRAHDNAFAFMARAAVANLGVPHVRLIEGDDGEGLSRAVVNGFGDRNDKRLFEPVKEPEEPRKPEPVVKQLTAVFPAEQATSRVAVWGGEGLEFPLTRRRRD
jgi:hypothetical protein